MYQRWVCERKSGRRIDGVLRLVNVCIVHVIVLKCVVVCAYVRTYVGTHTYVHMCLSVCLPVFLSVYIDSVSGVGAVRRYDRAPRARSQEGKQGAADALCSSHFQGVHLPATHSSYFPSF